MPHLLPYTGRLMLLLALLLARPALAQTTSFGVTGSPQYYTVPANVTQLVVAAIGAYNGATVRATVAVTPGETLTAVVGYQGLNSFAGPTGCCVPITGITPGYNGGGYDGSTYYYPSLSVGGGATDLRRSGTSTGDYLSSRNALLVAGGGGSGCDTESSNYFNSTCMGGGGGTPNGGNGTGTSPGTGATQTGIGSSTGSPASNNLGGVGNNYGGSGGGGYYGGGSGTGSGTGTSLRTGGGGGGSSWVMTGSSAVSYGSGGGNLDGSMTITPVAPVITSPPALTAPANGSTVATATPTYTGTASANSTVRLYVDGSATPFTTTATGSGTFSFAQPTALAQGSHTVRATAQSSGLAVSASSATNTFTVDTPTPAPVVSAPANGSFIATATPTYTGTAVAGSTVRLYVDGSLRGSTTATGSGTFSFAQPTALAQGSHTVYATAQSGSQVVSASSPTNTFTVDTVAPTAVLSTSAGSSTGVAPIPFTVTFSEGATGLGVSGISVTGGTVTGGTVSGTSGGTTYTFTITPTGSGTVVTVRVLASAAQDAAGNNSLASNPISVTYNGPPPLADLNNSGTLLMVQAGGILYVGTGGFGNQGGTTTNHGALRVDGPLTNPATLDLGAGTLEVKGDLTNAGTVVPGTGAVTFSGAADQLLTPGGATLYQVLVNKPTAGANTLRLAGDLTVSNQLSLSNGQVNTKNGATVSTLRLPNGATLSGEATGRYVQGALQITRNAVSGAPVNFGHGAVLDPKTSNLGTVAITRTAGLLTDDVSRGVNFANAAYKGIDRIWTVVPTTQPSAAVQLTLSWLPDNDNGLASFTQSRMWQQTAPGQRWTYAGPVANGSSRSLVGTPTVLNRFTVGNAANPLPVTLTDFTAQAEGPAAVRLKWATATELNNAGFTVERSADARSFAAIGTVAGAGTSTTPRDYALLDQQLPAGAALLYYRLRQADLSGDFTYSPVRTVALTPQAAGFVVYPTTVSAGQGATYLYTGPAEAGTLHVLNVLGQVLSTVALDGRATGPVPLAGLAAGTYFLRYTGPAGRFTTRCVVD